MNQSIEPYIDYSALGEANCSQGLGQFGQNQGGFGLLTQYQPCYIQQIPVTRPNSRELVIQWITPGKISLDYGEDIRLLMAEPVAGMKLREAIQLLKEALCKLDPHQ